MPICIAIDAQSGDYGLDTTVPACLSALKTFDDIVLMLVGQEELIKQSLQQYDSKKRYQDRYQIHHASQVIAMDDGLISALRQKDSSMRSALKLVKKGDCEACVSAGHSGALMAISKLVLKTIPGIDRPAMFTRLPTQTDQDTYMLDLGANIDSNAQALLSFAVMGSIVVKYTQNIKSPRIGLLNIGSEDSKGKQILKDTAELLRESDLNYTGFIEADTLYSQPVDVVVCDGYEGNLVLKASEGVANMINSYLKAAFARNILTRISAVLALPALKYFKSALDPKRYNGASLLGLRGVVIKSHGNADSVGFFYAIKEARIESYNHITDKIQAKIQKKLAKLDANKLD